MSPNRDTVNTLVLDLGNSTLFVGYFRGETLVKSFRLPRAEATDPTVLPKALGPRRAGAVDAIALCSVVPTETERLVSNLRGIFACEPRLLRADAGCAGCAGYAGCERGARRQGRRTVGRPRGTGRRNSPIAPAGTTGDAGGTGGTGT